MTVATTSSNAPDAAALLARAAAIRPVLERNADTTDTLRRLADENVQALRESGLCRLMVPARFGGYQTSIRTYIEVMAELGRGCGSTSWVASLINVCAWLAALFPEQAQADIWGADRDAWIAGSLAPNGAAVPVDGGWRVSGRWPWASGSMHAQWAACGIHMKNDAGEMANFGLSLLPMRELDGGRHLVHGRDERHWQQHHRRVRRVRAGAPLPAVPRRLRRPLSHRAHRTKWFTAPR